MRWNKGALISWARWEGYFNSILRLENREEASSKGNNAPLIHTQAQKLKKSELSTARADEKRQTGDLTVYNYYCRSAGWLNIAFTVSLDVVSAFCVVFSSDSPLI